MDAWTRLQELWGAATAIWLAGGWGMAAIALDAVVLFALGCHAWLRLREKGTAAVTEVQLREWVADPARRSGPVGELIAEVSGAPTVEATDLIFQGVHQAELAPFRRDLRVMKIAVGTAPLLGLFGTVTGMLATFGALASGSGGEQTMGLVAKGISEALITTETGLVVALPGLFFHYQIARRVERHAAFLSHLETLVTQDQYRRQRGPRGAVAAPALAAAV